MTSPQPAPAHLPAQVLGPEARDAYRRMLAGNLLPAAAPGVDRLRELGLATPVSFDPDLHAAISPRHAERIARDHALATLRSAVEDAQALAAFMADLNEELPKAPNKASEHVPSELLEGGPDIDAALEELVAQAQTEIWTAQPNADRPKIVRETGSFRDWRAMRRGVSYRTIYASAACASATAHRFAEVAETHGGQVRHTSHPFQRMILFDRDTAVVPAVPESHQSAATSGLRAWVIRDAGAVAFLRHEFELTWSHAHSWGPARERSTTNTLHRQILRGLSSGLTQAQVAASLKMTAGYVSTSLRELRQKLGFTTREQVLIWWATSSEQHLFDPEPE